MALLRTKLPTPSVQKRIGFPLYLYKASNLAVIVEQALLISSMVNLSHSFSMAVNDLSALESRDTS